MRAASLSETVLVPDAGIAVVDGGTVASACPAWLRLEPVAALARRRWIRLRYSASFFDEPVRPLIRFTTAKGETITQPMNGPVLGTAEWIGRVPDGTVRAAISPVARTGPFAFRLDEVAAIARPALAWRGLRSGPDWLYWALRSKWMQSDREAWQALGFALGGTPVAHYAQWHARLARPLELDGLDRPRSDWRRGPVFRFVMRLGGDGDIDRLRATLRSLRAQVYPRWTLCALAAAGTHPALLAAFRDLAASERRLSALPADGATPPRPGEDFAPDDFVGRIDSGDTLPAYALAVVAEAAARDPALALAYSDEDETARDGAPACPVFKPGWHPTAVDSAGFFGRLALCRVRVLAADERERLLLDEDDAALAAVAKRLTPSAIRHIRRVLYTRGAPRDGGGAARHAAPVIRTGDPASWPDVAVVIPTRDHAALLAECLRGLREKTDYPRLDIVVVDNGSSAPDALALLDDIATAPRTTVLRRPGPFNYAALSNDGARATPAPMLLFLNNDIAMLAPDWLRAMVRLAVRPEIGAVGARLLFANRRIQHAGVVLGFGGIAGHLYRRLPQRSPGYLHALAGPRAVSAVTGACLAVARDKFGAVGGFDAEHLPVDLNDIDFCLRLGERGWTNVLTPEATLIHLQSATRGIDDDPFALYRKERTYFVERWREAIRDDPFFHPGLSLYAHEVALA